MNCRTVHKVTMKSDFDVQCRRVVGNIVREIDRVCRTTVLSSEKSKKYRFKVDGKFTRPERDEISWWVFESCRVNIRWRDANTVEVDLQEVMEVIPSW